MEEEWKDIAGFEGEYAISNFGRVKNLRSGKFLKPSANPKNKYYLVGLAKKGKYQYKYIHRLIAEAFIPNPDHFPQVNHINENRQDNSLENLEWCTNQYNNEYSHGKPITQLSLNGEVIAQWKSGRHIRRVLGYDESVIGKVCRDKIHTAYGYKWTFSDREGK